VYPAIITANTAQHHVQQKDFQQLLWAYLDDNDAFIISNMQYFGNC